MSKSIILTFFTFILMPQLAQAQFFATEEAKNQAAPVENIQQQSAEMNVAPSKEYIKNLRTCRPFKEDIALSDNGLTINTTLEIVGVSRNNLCRVRTLVRAKQGVFSSNCSLNHQNLLLYADLWEKQINSQIDPASMRDVLQEFYNTISDPNVCYIRYELDETKELRGKLTKCEPYTQTLYRESGYIDLKIDGYQGNDCIVSYDIHQMLPMNANIKQSPKNKDLPPEQPRDTIATFRCQLTGFNVEELKLVFEQAAIKTNKLSVALDENTNKRTAALMEKFVNEGTCVMQDITQ